MAEISGRYDYDSLRLRLQRGGVEQKDMYAALRKIASQNGIDNIEELDGSETIKIDMSIFNPMAAQGGVNPVMPMGMNPVDSEGMPDPSLALMPYMIQGNDNLTALPEVFNDEDYEVVDYDDFYGFNPPPPPPEMMAQGQQPPVQPNSEAENGQNGGNANDMIDFDTFNKQYAQTFATGTIQDSKQQEEMMREIFGTADWDSNDYLDKTELASALYRAMQPREQDMTETTPKEGEDFLGSGMMDMDMSNDSFNPQ